MADGTGHAGENVETYWRNVSINFGDGPPTHYRLDLPTFRRVVANEPEVMQLLKSKRHLAELANNVDCTDSEMPLPAQPLSKSPPPPNSQGSAVPKPTPQHEVNEERQDDSGRKMPKIWGVAETKLLVNIRVEMDNLFINGKRAHKTLWVEVANKMKEKGHGDITDEHCSNKWKSLKRTYKETVDHNAKTGNDPKTCAFQNEFDDLYGNNPATRPKFTVDDMEGTEDDNVNDGHDNGDDHAEDKVRKSKGLSGRKSREKAPGATLQWLTEYTNSQEVKRKDRDEANERRHKDKMARFDRLLDILDK